MFVRSLQHASPLFFAPYQHGVSTCCLASIGWMGEWRSRWLSNIPGFRSPFRLYFVDAPSRCQRILRPAYGSHVGSPSKSAVRSTEHHTCTPLLHAIPLQSRQSTLSESKIEGRGFSPITNPTESSCSPGTYRHDRPFVMRLARPWLVCRACSYCSSDACGWEM